MNLFGWNITISKAVTGAVSPPGDWNYNFGMPFWGSGNTWGMPGIETFPGAWQRNLEKRPDSLLAFYAVYACISLISSDISKLRLRLMEEDDRDIEREVVVSAFSPLLRKPNHYQTRIKFFETWLISKLSRGNFYALKERDARGVIVALYPLDPGKVKPLVAPDGSVFYDIGGDVLSGIPDGLVTAPASEVIHDIMMPLFHPLCGVSPIYACAYAALQGLTIQQSSTQFFARGSNPGGVLTAPGAINDATAKRLKDHWEQNYSGGNGIGKVAVLGDGLKYEAMAIAATDAQLIEQLKWTAETVCAVFKVPPFMIGIGPTPAYNNIEALSQQYYAQCLQALMESIELLMDEGLGLPNVAGHSYQTEFDIDALLRMDTATKVQAARDSLQAGFLSPNEARARFGLAPVEGGEFPVMQQQNWPLPALANRPPPSDGAAAPAAAGPAPAAAAEDDEEPPPDEVSDNERAASIAAALFARAAEFRRAVA